MVAAPAAGLLPVKVADCMSLTAVATSSPAAVLPGARAPPPRALGEEWVVGG